MKFWMFAATALSIVFSLTSPTEAWHRVEHERITVVAVASLPDEIPAFLRRSTDAIASYSNDPDIMRLRQTPQLRNAEAPNHFIDLELLQGKPLPPLRYDYYAMCFELGVDPHKAGSAPYAIVEQMQRLTTSFAEYRRWPMDPHIRRRVLLNVGHMAHYAQDVCNPLHTTVHFDGRVDETGKSLGDDAGKGIHEPTDGLLSRLEIDMDAMAKSIKPVPYEDDIFAAVMTEVMTSHALVDRVYELEAPLRNAYAKKGASEEVIAFGQSRMTHAVTFTARLIVTAWAASEYLKLPPWHHRSATVRKQNPATADLPALGD